MCDGHAEPSTRDGHRRVGHHRRALRHLVADLPHLLDVLVVGLAEVVPDRRVARHDVRLIAAVGDDVVRALLEAQVLAAEVPADVHQLDRVERALPRHGAPALCALSPLNVYSTETRPLPPLVAPRRRQVACRRGCNSTMSTSLKTPSRT